MKQASDEAEISKVAKLWAAFKAVGKHIVDTERIVSAYVKLLEHAHSASEKVI